MRPLKNLLCNAPEDTYNQEGRLILQDFFNDKVAEGVASDPQDFIITGSQPCLLLRDNFMIDNV